MLVSAFAALVMFAAPEAAQATDAATETKAVEAKAGPKKTCYTATPSGSRMPRKVCVTQSAKGDEKSEQHSADRKPAEAKPE
jgi:uncharacterized protein YraI